MSDARRRRVTPRRVALAAGVVAFVVAGAALAVVSSRPPDDPHRTSTPAATPVDAGVDPTAPWWERVPPVEGDLLPINRYAAGHVTIVRAGDHALTVRIDHFNLAWATAEGSGGPGEARVVLSAGTVIGERRGYWSEQRGAATVGTVQVDTDARHRVPSTVEFRVDDPDRLPADVRSVVVLRVSDDPALDGEVLGGAALLPAD
ncbi:hypothetical protein JOE58_000301 [Curtobacterium luteum]|uniref:Uncharacterized protein n=1 Tax=Curtobacterium luteum TaxID=33881 RepID=A0A8H9GAJ0_9MICO|nr:hypothetical protein [Curtobacterium luteum]MBM7801050.1 hypothetical protein [Curtobacterium luteum]NUU50617.1 hypothetical protein [Curtobacterium luteum]GGL05829.1 hypothetical protein GCM10009769_25060 [Curtobacterium luteum]